MKRFSSGVILVGGINQVDDTLRVGRLGLGPKRSRGRLPFQLQIVRDISDKPGDRFRDWI